jgi:hypothetical protein
VSRLLYAIRRASAAIYRVLIIGLLAFVYALVLPWLALAFRLGSRKSGGWRVRRDTEVASIERLRSLY